MRSFTFVLAVACLLLLAPRLASAAGAYSMADLEALDRQESWHELLVHASDVPPSNRSDRWRQMVERAALGVLASHAGEADKAWGFADAVLRQYPQLKKSKRFMAQRAEVGVRGLEACLGATDIAPCVGRAVAFVEAVRSDAGTGITMAEMIARHLPSAAVGVFRRALTIRRATKDCSGELLKRSVGDALSLDSADSRVADARAIGADLCWDGLKESLVDRFIDGNKNFRKNSCPFLMKKKNALSPMSRRQCEAMK
jgi:hypothetical protein